jgi:hypothetical protein
MDDMTPIEPLLLAAQLGRAEELERRAWEGTDNIAYCIGQVHTRAAAPDQVADQVCGPQVRDRFLRRLDEGDGDG